MNNTKPTISASEVINHLHNGVTRKKTSKGYNPTLRSIEEIYNLKPSHVDLLFKHPSLKGIKVRTPKEKPFEFIDDVTSQGTPVNFDTLNEILDTDSNSNIPSSPTDMPVSPVLPAEDTTTEVEQL